MTFAPMTESRWNVRLPVSSHAAAYLEATSSLEQYNGTFSMGFVVDPQSPGADAIHSLRKEYWLKKSTSEPFDRV